ncbi:hypothetical protein [Cardinium endosymbiont of Culicoides punctatus]|uniref:hypothetical protein n=1 Tax=Cardinium endosymbiont of Culicoides punctatus TaxID=2304601 RepID=UPI001058A939|nr:hypothetical protein [Cardinium endosymbiont of Culicoides punctatus]TDG93362.1 hypothetical protein CCPUN_08830 [Cardinium endosymbiont of Culicoides punctatus]
MKFRLFMLFLSIVLAIKSCKSPAASSSTTSVQANGPEKVNSERGKSTSSSKASEEEYKEKPSKPIFSLKDITIQTGNTEEMILEVQGPIEGYVVKSITINGKYDVHNFQLSALKNQSIPSTGLTFSINPVNTLRPGAYRLTIKVGKIGCGSRATEQYISCTITISTKPEETNLPSSEQQKCTNSDSNKKPDRVSKEKKKGKKSKANATEDANLSDPTRDFPLFTKSLPEPDTIPIYTFLCTNGQNTVITYDLDNTLEKFQIQTIKIVKQPNGKNSTALNRFGLDKYKKGGIFNKSITISTSINQSGMYRLTVEIKNTNSSETWISVCNIQLGNN